MVFFIFRVKNKSNKNDYFSWLRDQLTTFIFLISFLAYSVRPKNKSRDTIAIVCCSNNGKLLLTFVFRGCGCCGPFIWFKRLSRFFGFKRQKKTVNFSNQSVTTESNNANNNNSQRDQRSSRTNRQTILFEFVINSWYRMFIWFLNLCKSMIIYCFLSTERERWPARKSAPSTWLDQGENGEEKYVHIWKTRRKYRAFWRDVELKVLIEFGLNWLDVWKLFMFSFIPSQFRRLYDVSAFGEWRGWRRRRRWTSWSREWARRSAMLTDIHTA